MARGPPGDTEALDQRREAGKDESIWVVKALECWEMKLAAPRVGYVE